jgi:hypothetical protein
MANILKHKTGNQHFWERHLIQWRESGSSQAEYCRNNKLKEHTFSYHKCKHTNKNAPKNNAQTGFIKVQMPANKIEPETLTLRFNNGTSLSGITESNLALVKQLAMVFS